jgi:hypothetical protein
MLEETKDIDIEPMSYPYCMFLFRQSLLLVASTSTVIAKCYCFYL